MFESIKSEAIWLAFLCLLCGCSHKATVSETSTGATKAAIEALEESLPKECATQAITKQITAIKAQIESVQVACNTEKALAVREQERKTWLWRITSIVLGALLALFAKFKI